MLVHPNFDPVAIAIGPFSIKWYGLMYLVGFGGAYLLGRIRIAGGRAGRVTVEVLDDIIFYGVLGVILGGRLGYVLFYKPGYYFAHPLEIPQIWAGGMSFHGGFLGVLVAITFVMRKHRIPWFTLTDFIAPMIPVGLATGRIGNFINGELFGRTTDVAWGMVFPGGGPTPRHPSQLYQFAMEGVALFFILWFFSAKPRPRAAVSALFLIGYGVFRFVAEFFREPDDFLGTLALGMSMGQWLSLPMIVAGIAMMIWAYRRNVRDDPTPPAATGAQAR